MDLKIAKYRSLLSIRRLYEVNKGIFNLSTFENTLTHPFETYIIKKLHFSAFWPYMAYLAEPCGFLLIKK